MKKKNYIWIPIYAKGRGPRSSERIFGFKKIPDITCPLIDSVIADVETLKDNKNIRKIAKINKALEKIRSANEDLRNIMYEWKTLCKELLDKHRPAWREKSKKRNPYLKRY